MAWVCPKCGCGNIDEYEVCIRCNNAGNNLDLELK